VRRQHRKQVGCEDNLSRRKKLIHREHHPSSATDGFERFVNKTMGATRKADQQVLRCAVALKIEVNTRQGMIWSHDANIFPFVETPASKGIGCVALICLSADRFGLYCWEVAQCKVKLGRGEQFSWITGEERSNALGKSGGLLSCFAHQRWNQ